MADAQIVRSDVSGVPADYTVPGTSRIELKAVAAEYADNGAGSSWLPCVEILSDSGHVIARACDQGVSVAAGGSAEVSWFPRVGRAQAASSAAGAPDYLFLQGVGQTITRPPIGDNDHAKFNAATADSNSIGTWTLVLDGGGNVKEVDTTTPGRYLGICNFDWSIPAASSTFVVTMDFFGGTSFAASPAAKLTTAGEWIDTVSGMTYLTSGTLQMDVIAAVTAGDASITFDAIYWQIFRWPS